MFYKIRTDLDKLMYATHITKIICDVTTENENSYKVLQLLLNTLYIISETDKNMDFVLSIFKIRLLAILGFTPHVQKCTNCGSDDILYFSIRDNGFKCGICAKQDKSSLQISKGTIDAIRYIVLSPPKKLFSFDVTDNCKKELEIVSKLYFNEKLEKEYKLEEMF